MYGGRASTRPRGAGGLGGATSTSTVASTVGLWALLVAPVEAGSATGGSRRGTMRFGAAGAAGLRDFACGDGNAASGGEKCVSRGFEGEHLLRRSEILEALGERAKRGDNRFTNGRGATVAPLSPRTTADMAVEMGISERSSMVANNAFRCVEAAELGNSTGLGRSAASGGKKCVSRGIGAGRPGGVSRLGGVRGCW